MGYSSTFERDLFLEIDQGVVTGTRIRNNGISISADAPNGYGVAAMTVFPRLDKREGDAE
jgi:hypothetical protein